MPQCLNIASGCMALCQMDSLEPNATGKIELRTHFVESQPVGLLVYNSGDDTVSAVGG